MSSDTIKVIKVTQFELKKMARTVGQLCLENVENVKKENTLKVLKLMSNFINYISHPSITTTLECNINFTMFVNALTNILHNEPRVSWALEKMGVNLSYTNGDAVEILLKSYINIKFERKGGLLIFKEIEALKILYVLIVMINESDHPLYPCYLEWVKDENVCIVDGIAKFTLVNL